MKRVKIMSKTIPAYITDFGKVLKGKAFQDKAYLYPVSVPRFIVWTSGEHKIVASGNDLNSLRIKYGSDLPVVVVK